MMKTFENAGLAGKDFADNAMKSAASVTKGFQSIAAEAADYSRKSVESASAAAEQLMAARTLDKAVEVQSEFAKTAWEGLVAETSKLNELYADMAKEAFKPFEGLFSKAA